jgi:integrase
MAGYYEKTKNGKYRLFASGGTGPDGKRKRPTKTIAAKSDREAEKELAKFVAEVEKNEYVESSKFTFKDFVDRWLRDYAEVEDNLAPKTRYRYKEILDSRIIPAMGHLKMEKITPVHLLGFYRNLQEDGVRKDGKKGGLSAKTILQHHRVISSILSCAVQWQVISSNPAGKVKPLSKVPKKQTTCYDENQVATLLTAMEGEELKYQVLVQLAIFTGQRRGELLGLEWQDINLDKATLTVRQASQYLPKRGVFTKNPKNESSERLLSLPPFLVHMLQEYRKEQVKDRLKVGELWQGSDRLFTTWDGQPMHPDTVSSWWPKFIRTYNTREAFDAEIAAIRNKLSAEELDTLESLREPYIKLNGANSKSMKKKLDAVEDKIINIIGRKSLDRIRRGQKLPPLNFHGLRHTAATMMINQGLPTKSISGRLGHANISTTMDIYGHYLKSADKEAADRLEQAYQNIKGNCKTDAKKRQI